MNYINKLNDLLSKLSLFSFGDCSTLTKTKQKREILQLVEIKFVHLF